MISFRYHIVTLVSVFLALAIGIALGGGPLKGGVDNSLVQDLAARKKLEDLQRQQIKELRATADFY
ncbi:MAG: copper transporter, partial [Actinomycetota bacterium]|nr:copper transporter [Actinomycetota bacterium]